MSDKRQSSESFKAGNLQRRKILSLCHELGWTYLSTGGRIVVDMHGLNRWCENYGYLHKPLNYYTPSELPKLVTQFEQMTAKELASRNKQEHANTRILKSIKNAKQFRKNGSICCSGY